MRIDKVDNTMFLAKNVSKFVALGNLHKDKKVIDLKPIKNYSQYIKEYGLDKKAGK